MKKAHVLFIYLFCLSLAQTLQAQVTTIPEFPTADEPVTIIYDATLGTSGLVGASSVHMHSGVVLTGPSGTTWENVVGEWGNPASPGQMIPVAGEANKWQITITPRDYYGVASGITIYRLSMVFRESGPCGGFEGNDTPCAEGKSDSNGDIYVDLFAPGLNVSISTPTEDNFFADINVPISISANASEVADMTIEVNGTLIISQTDVESIATSYTPTTTGNFEVVVTADNGSEIASESFNFVVAPATMTQAIPSGIVNGINYNDSDPTRATLVLNTGVASVKDKIFILGDFNDWEIDVVYQMKKDTDSKRFWLEITGLTPGTEYAFQYLIDGEQRLADPFADKVLYPFNDQFIPTTTYPDLKPYPTGQTTGIVSVLQTDQSPYAWSITDFTKPDKADLVIYELLVRDFDMERNFQDVIDRLDYLEDLGINALQLMPVGEFDGNISWGYNPSFYFAVDKAYGTKNKLKELIDKCHARGIAVILDVVLNHAHETFPYMAMYSEGFQATPQNPWFNVDARHPFNVFNDLNHDHPETKALLDTFNIYWLREYKLDGFRFDLSKGFTQNNDCGGSQDNVACWNAKDDSRIANLTRMADMIWAEDADAYVILEHLGNNDEETELANYGMMLWGNMHGSYKEAAMGYNNSLAWGYHGTRGWSDPHLVAYMESHDEERLMYDNLNNGNSSGSYNIQNLDTALDRIKQSAAFFYTIPGPKMLWQFGEVGYDFSINYCENGSISPDCRTAPKPIRWDYFEDANRKKLYDVYSALIKLKTENEVFKNGTYTLSESGPNNYEKIITITHSTNNVVVLGNFDVVTRTFSVNFPNAGNWYDYLSNDRIEITGSTTLSFTLEPGQFHILTSTDIELPNNVGGGLVPFILPNRVVTAPITPSNLSASVASSNRSVLLAWQDNADNETRYAVERSVVDNTNFTTLIQLSPNSESYEDVSVSGNETYFYRVKAVLQEGGNTLESGYSNEASVVLTSLENNRFAENITIYPNPAQDSFTLSYSNSYQGKIKVNILDSKGKIVEVFELSKTNFEIEALLSLKKLSSGLYFVEITQEDTQRGLKRLIKK